MRLGFVAVSCFTISATPKIWVYQRVLTIAREQSVRFAVGLMARHAIAAIVSSMRLAWGGNGL